MKQYDPNDLVAMEEYYRRQLLEMSKKASPKPPQTPPVPPAAEAKKQTPPPEIVPPVSKLQASPDPLPPKPEQQPEPQPSVYDLKFFQTARSERPAFRTEQQTGSELLQQIPKTLRPASMVQPLRGGTKGYGTIKAQVTTALGALPIRGAVVIIELAEEGKKLVEYLVTDASGNTPESKPLLTAAASQSLSPNAQGTPYTSYRVVVRAAGFSPYTAEQVPVFDGQVSKVEAALQPVRREESPYA